MAKASVPFKRGGTTAKPRSTPAAGAARAPGAEPASPHATRPKPERVRGGEARSIADLIPQVGDTAFRKFGFVQSSILTRWNEIVGSRLAKVTSAESLRFPRGKQTNGVLYISVSGAHAVIVQHAIPDIMARVNSFFGYAAVAGVRLKQGRVTPPAAPTRAATAQPLDSADPPRAPSPTPVVDRAPPAGLKNIADPELRTVLEALALSLARRDGQDKSR